MAKPPQSVQSLTERFARHCDDYHKGRYNETQVRREFIDPLFVALGWDVHNLAGYAEAYKDVIHEDAIKVGGVTKAPDYCFRIGGARKFFLEAKKPSVDIAGEPGPAYQLRRYAWSAKLPLSVLTDFEEFAVYDCRIRPKPTDKASAARTLYIRYDEYAARWDEIASIFSKEAVLQGSFDKYAAGRKKRGTAEVDAEFLREIEKWRDALARNIALRNPQLTSRELNFAVQRTIDRIIFLRICEDRGVETYASLQALINGQRVYARLMQMFRAADDRYNSGLFHFNAERDRPAAPDSLTPTLNIDDKPLKDIFRSLYYPQSPYEFAVLPADILGNVYEQFLGKVIHLTAGHRARVEEKPEVKKAGGVYYTPKYIVDYIVAHTLGKILGKRLTTEDTENAESLKKGKKDSSVSFNTSATSVSSVVNSFSKTPKQVSRLRILDPACGSGSFLVGAYRKLLEYHRDWYLDDGAEKHTKKVYQGAASQWFLTTAEKKRILLNNIYGVDIDPQAVEVTKLNLLLCALENENQTTLGQLNLIHQRALPDLSSNIKCGNSLIGLDFYEGAQMSLFDEDARWKINAFDWPEEFPEIFKGKNPGFDAVIGNPPYVRVHRLDKSTKEYLWEKYKTFVAKSDLYNCFMERSFYLLKRSGLLSMITPHTWTSLESFEGIRRLFFEESKICLLCQLPKKVFRKATVQTCVFVIERTVRQEDTLGNMIEVHSLSERSCGVAREFKQSEIGRYHLHNFLLYSDQGLRALYDKVSSNAHCLEELVLFRYGLKTGDDAQFLTRESKGQKYKKLVRSANIARYSLDYLGEFVRYAPVEMKAHRKTARPGERERFESPKVVVSRMGRALVATFDIEKYYIKDGMLLLGPCPYDLRYIVGLLNSRLLNHIYTHFFVTVDVLKNAILALPIRKLDLGKVQDKAAHDRMVSLVESMLDLHKQLSSARVEHDKTLIQRQISATDGQIDKLVYELYGLTEEEIKILEEGYEKQSN